MCSTLSVTKPAPKKAPRVCRWLVEKTAAREMLLANLAVPFLAIEKGVTSYYWLSRSHRAGAWKVAKESPDGSEPTIYTVDCGDAADREDFRCDHNQINGFCGKVATGCKHCCLTAALLKSVGIIP